MQINVQRISPVVMEFQVEIPSDRVKAEVDKAYRTLEKTAQLRGFRKGKAPRNVLAHLFGPKVQSDVTQAIVNDTLPRALSEKNVIPVSQPQVEPGRLDPNGGAFTYKARFEVQPELEDVKYEGFELTRPATGADETMVEEQLGMLQKQHARLQPPDPSRPAKTGDVVTIDFTLSIDGKEKKDAGGQGVQLELGSGQVLPDLEKALEGKSASDKFEVETTFPEGHASAELRGKKGSFSGVVQDIKEKVLPAVDDDLAKELGKQTVIELRADIHTQLEKALKDRAELALAEQIVQKLNDLNPCDVPPTLVQQQQQIMLQEIAMQARRAGQRLSQEAVQQLFGRVKEDAEKKVRAGLVMAAIAKKNGFQVTEDDIEKGIVELAQETGKNPAKLKVEYRDQQKRQMLIGMILEDKILDFLESKSKITDAPKDAPKAEATETPAKESEKSETTK